MNYIQIPKLIQTKIRDGSNFENVFVMGTATKLSLLEIFLLYILPLNDSFANNKVQKIQVRPR